MVLITEWSLCPVGCGVGMVILKAVGSGKLFLYCTACEIACETIPTESSPAELNDPEHYAALGISLPTRAEVETAGLGQLVFWDFPESEYESQLWRLWARTAIEEGDFERANKILNQVIETWHIPPPAAFAMCAEVERRKKK